MYIHQGNVDAPIVYTTKVIEFRYKFPLYLVLFWLFGVLLHLQTFSPSLKFVFLFKNN